MFPFFRVVELERVIVTSSKEEFSRVVKIERRYGRFAFGRLEELLWASALGIYRVMKALISS